MSREIIKENFKGKKAKCVLIKKNETWGDKIVYEGTLRGAKKRIPPSKKDRYEIQFKK